MMNATAARTARFSFFTFFVLSLGQGLLGCSSSGPLQKFDDHDLSQGVAADIAKKFEVKDDVPVAAASPVPPQSAQAPETNRKKRKKKLHKKDVEATVKKTEPQKVTAEVPPLRRQDPMPFTVGEKLEYAIRYIGVTAGVFNMEVLPFKEIENRKVYHFEGRAKTIKIFELVYRVDDQLESYWDYDGLFSYRFTMNLDESKQTRNVVELNDYDQKKCFYWDRVNHVEKGKSEKREENTIPLWSQDVLSAIYYVRALILPDQPGQEVRFPTTLDGKPWEVAIQFEKKGKVWANGKDNEANIYRLDTYENGVLKNKNNTIWISNDEHRYLLRIEAKVKVGSFAIALDKVL